MRRTKSENERSGASHQSKSIDNVAQEDTLIDSILKEGQRGH